MPTVLGPVATTDNYPSDGLAGAATIICGPIVRVNITLSGNPVWYQLRSSQGWEFEDYLVAAPGITFFFSYDRFCRGIRFRSATSGKSANVVASLFADWEIPPQNA